MAPTKASFTMRGERPTDGPAPDPETPTGPEPLEPDESVDVAEERRRLDIDTVFDRMDRELVGLEPVKTRIRQLAALLLVDRLRHRYGLTSTRPTLHMCFTGGPGTGKTTMALRIAELLKSLGYLERGHLVTVTRDELVGQYIGHTAPKTKEVLKRAMGGVLFIDEAYYLYRAENERDYGAEAIEILLQVMENDREDLVVILAGYKDRMDRFFQANPGMSSRIAHHIDFPDYSIDELVAIADLMLAEQRYELSPDAREAFRRYLERRVSQPRFANGRSVRNALERARLRQANRIVSSEQRRFRRQDLMRLEPDDILASRVMAGEPEDDGASADPRKDDATCA